MRKHAYGAYCQVLHTKACAFYVILCYWSHNQYYTWWCDQAISASSRPPQDILRGVWKISGYCQLSYGITPTRRHTGLWATSCILVLLLWKNEWNFSFYPDKQSIYRVRDPWTIFMGFYIRSYRTSHPPNFSNLPTGSEWDYFTRWCSTAFSMHVFSSKMGLVNVLYTTWTKIWDATECWQRWRRFIAMVHKVDAPK